MCRRDGLTGFFLPPLGDDEAGYKITGLEEELHSPELPKGSCRDSHSIRLGQSLLLELPLLGILYLVVRK